jgi:hypothetical protein
LNEIIGRFHPTTDVKFATSAADVASLRSSFTAQRADLFQPFISPKMPEGSTTHRAPIGLPSGDVFTLPGSLTGYNCQDQVPVLFGVNRDITCKLSDASQVRHSIV